MAATIAHSLAPVALSQRQQLRPSHQQRAAFVRPQQQARLRCAPARAAAGQNGNGSGMLAGTSEQQHVMKMVNLVHDYFDDLLSRKDVSVAASILDKNISHKDMVRNIGRVGMQEYEKYLNDLHKLYPEYYVKPTHFGYADERSMFVSFEGQVSPKSDFFYGVDLFIFNDSATKIREVQVYRSNWLGAQGHEQRKKAAEAAARADAEAALRKQQRGQLP